MLLGFLGHSAKKTICPICGKDILAVSQQGWPATVWALEISGDLHECRTLDRFLTDLRAGRAGEWSHAN